VFDYTVDVRQLKIIFGKGDARIAFCAEMLDMEEPPLKQISEILKHDEVYIEIVLGDGPYSEKVWGCDLTEEYVRVNAHYTT
jgi:glutamate N-acetyltransferase/amino-acid N-acetyltransferase